MKKSNHQGFGIRYDRDYGGNHIAAEAQKSLANGYRITFQMRFCETCQTLKPKGRRPAVKGWKCDDCLSRRQ